MRHPIGSLRLRQAGADDVLLCSEAWSDCCCFALPLLLGDGRHHRHEGHEGLGLHQQPEGDPAIRCSVHLCPSEDSIDYAENPRKSGITGALLWVSPGTPAKRCPFAG